MEFLNRDPACGETPIKEEEMGFVVKEEEAEKNVFKEEEGEEAIGDSVLPKVIQMDPDAEVLLIDSESDDEDLITTKKANSDSEMERSLSESDEEEDLLVQRASVLPTASPSGRYYTRRSAPSSHLPAPHTSARRSSTPLSQSSDSDPDFEESPSKRRPAPQPIPKSKRARGGSATSRLNEEGAWHNREDTDEEPEPLQFKPRRPPGPTIDTTRTWSPLSLFQLFFSKSVIHTLITNTNANAAKRIASGMKFTWDVLTVKEFYIFLAIILFSGLVRVRHRADFWRKNFPYHFNFPGDQMIRNRFEAIMWSLHLSNPQEDEDNDRKKGTASHDRLFKIKPLYTDIVAACKSHFQPHQNISIDERMVASKARISFKQYMKNKPTKWGYKLFVLADSSTAYTWNFFVYSGKTFASGKGLGYSSVIDLLPFNMLGSGYKLFVDNFYTSPALFRDLSIRKFVCCGTIRKGRVGFPKTEQNTLDKMAERGDLRWIRKEGLLFLKWMDTREVNICSSFHKAYSGQTVTRRRKEGGVWSLKDIPVPDAILDYNKNMGGVDLSDALIGYYSVLRKTMKWYKTFFFHFIDIAVVNSFLLHKELCKMKNERPMMHKTFRETLIVEFLEFAQSSQAPPQPEPPALTCMPVYYGEDGTKGRRYCRLCQDAGRPRVKTPVYCRKCQVPLCLTPKRNCYQEWHDRR